MRFFNIFTLIGAYNVFVGLYVMFLARGLLKLAGLAGIVVGIVCIWVGAGEK